MPVSGEPATGSPSTPRTAANAATLSGETVAPAGKTYPVVAAAAPRRRRAPTRPERASSSIRHRCRPTSHFARWGDDFAGLDRVGGRSPLASGNVSAAPGSLLPHALSATSVARSTGNERYADMTAETLRERPEFPAPVPWPAVVLAPLAKFLGSTAVRHRAPLTRSDAMTESVLAVTAAFWGIAMGLSPLLQVRRMRFTRRFATSQCPTSSCSTSASCCGSCTAWPART